MEARVTFDFQLTGVFCMVKLGNMERIAQHRVKFLNKLIVNFAIPILYFFLFLMVWYFIGP